VPTINSWIPARTCSHRDTIFELTLFVEMARNLLKISSMSSLLGTESAIFNVCINVRHGGILGRVAKVGCLERCDHLTMPMRQRSEVRNAQHEEERDDP